jgi:adenylate cyclase
VVTAASGIEALAKLTEENFDLLLTDHAMAGMNGLQLASVAKQMPGGKPVILMTASDQVASAMEENGGVDLVLRKPIPQKRLRQALREIFEAVAEAA